MAERFDRVREAGFDGMAIDLGAMDIAAARALVPEFARTGLNGLLTAFPRSIEELRPALHLAKDIGSPFVIVVGQVMPLAVADMAEVDQALGWRLPTRKAFRSSSRRIATASPTTFSRPCCCSTPSPKCG